MISLKMTGGSLVAKALDSEKSTSLAERLTQLVFPAPGSFQLQLQRGHSCVSSASMPLFYDPFSRVTWSPDPLIYMSGSQ